MADCLRFPDLGEKAKLVCIPNTSGTGSEVTPFAVITDTESGQKYPLADYALTPSVAIVDPVLTTRQPRTATADSGFDALTHCIETYVLDFARRLADLGKEVWGRFVLVPRLTDAAENIEGIAAFTASLGNVTRVDVLPFHKLGVAKWRALGLDFTLADTPTPTPDRTAAARAVFAAHGLNAVGPHPPHRGASSCPEKETPHRPTATRARAAGAVSAAGRQRSQAWSRTTGRAAQRRPRPQLSPAPVAASAMSSRA